MALFLFMYIFMSFNLILIFFSLDDVLLIISFTINLCLIAYGLFYSAKKRWLNIDLVIWNFKYLFFFFAPIIQINYGIFPNNLPIETEKILIVNLLLSIWFFIYLCLRNKKQISAPDHQFNFVNHKWVQNIYMVASLMITLFIFILFRFDFTFGFIGWDSIVGNKTNLLLITIITRGILYGNFVFQYDQFLLIRTTKQKITSIVSLIMLLLVVNPFNMPRYYIGFMIICTLFLFFRKRVSGLLFNVFIFIGIFVLFPLINFFRFGFTKIPFDEFKKLMFQQFTELHFDAYANIIATLDYVQSYGVTLGYQLLGSLFFFIPRAFWESKPLQTGEVIGNYLITNGKLDYNNLANALPSEMYINFGILGIIIGPILLSLLINHIEKNAKKEFLIYALLSGFIFYIFRGALMSGFAYCFGTIVVIQYGSKIILNLFKKMEKTII